MSWHYLFLHFRAWVAPSGSRWLHDSWVCRRLSAEPKSLLLALMLSLRSPWCQVMAWDLSWWPQWKTCSRCVLQWQIVSLHALLIVFILIGLKINKKQMILISTFPNAVDKDFKIWKILTVSCFARIWRQEMSQWNLKSFTLVRFRTWPVTRSWNKCWPLWKTTKWPWRVGTAYWCAIFYIKVFIKCTRFQRNLMFMPCLII